MKSKSLFVSMLIILIVATCYSSADVYADNSKTTEILLGKNYTWTLKKDEYYYKFTVNKSGKLHIDIESEGLLYACLLDQSKKHKYDQDFDQEELCLNLDWDNSTGDTEKYVGDIPVIAGTYYLKVNSMCIKHNVSLKISFTSSNESIVESQSSKYDTIAQAPTVSLNKKYTGYIAGEAYRMSPVEDREDYYRFTIKEKDSYSILFEKNKNFKIGIAVYDSKKRIVLFDYICCGTMSNKFARVLDKGDYYLHIFHWDGYCTRTDDSFGYKFSISQTDKHKYGSPTWKWDGTSKAVATFTCQYNENHTKKINAKITSKVTKKATVNTSGTKQYTATVTLNGKTYKKTKTVTYYLFDKSKTGIQKYNNNLYYVKKGIKDASFTGFAKYGTKWYYVVKGKVDTTKLGVVKGKVNGVSAIWYVKNGKVQLSFTGTVKINNKNYKIIKGKVQ